VTGSEFEHAGTPVTWSLSLRGVGDHVLVAIATLAVAPRPLWTWLVLIQPAIALAAVPWVGPLALAVFVVLSIAPLVVAWWLAIGQRRRRYTVSPTRATLRVSDLRTESSAADSSETVGIDLHEVDEIVAVPLRGRVAVRFPRDRTSTSESVPRIVLVPADRWPGVVAALTRAGVSLPWGEPPGQRPSLTLIAIVALSAIVPIAGVVVGAVLVFSRLLPL